MLTFEQPLLLLLLIPILILVYLTWRRMSLPFPAFQRYLILACRTLLFSLVILALAGTAWAQPVSHQATVFVGDISASTSSQRGFIEQWISNALKHKHAEDQVGIVAVGRNALVEQSVDTQIDFSQFQSAPDTSYTDLAAGLRLAAAILPTDAQRHIVLLTDGQQNLEDALQEAQLLQQQGIRLDIVPIPSPGGAEARIDGIDAPTQLRTNEHFVLHTKVYSSVAQNVTLRIYMDATLLSQQNIHVATGQQDISFNMPAPSNGFHTFRVTLEAPNDTIMQNNEAAAFVNVQGPPRVLVIEGQPGSGHNIIAALQATGMNVNVGGPGDLPSTLDGLVQYSSIVLADVPAPSLGDARMLALQSFVRDLGHGLVVSGGQNSYGIGGYANTSLEETLPVKMDIPQHKETPSIAVVLIVESLEAQVPINISKEAAKGVVNLLTPRDWVGISSGYGTLSIKMQHVSNKPDIDKAIDDLNPTDPPSYAQDLQYAESVLLNDSDAKNAKIKHVILLGDGDAYDSSYASVVTKMASEHISVSTVATNALSPQELGTMQQIAQWGKGRFYRADDASTIPQILLKETEQAARRNVITETFNPAVVGNHPILTGLNALPSLNGYVATTPKPTGQVVLVSHLDDPVLAVWQYGLGRVAAWTSDALGLWTKNWLEWNNAPRWWANLVTWSLPSPNDSALTVNGKVINGTGQLTVDLASGSPTQSGQQQVQVHIIAPDNSSQTITLEPTAPERWEGTFPTSQDGAYLVQVTWQSSTSGAKGGASRLTTQTGLVVPYSPEFRTQGTDMRFLRLLAQAGGGNLLQAADAATVFLQKLTPATASVPITFWLLMLAALLLPVDIAARRLSSFDFLVEGYQWLQARFKPAQTVGLATPTGRVEASTTSASLDHLRAKREARRSTVSTKIDARPPAKDNVPIPSVPSPKPAAATKQAQPARPAAVPRPQSKEPETATPSVASRLVEAKRKRGQPKS